MNKEMRARSYAVFASLAQERGIKPAKVASDLGLFASTLSDWKRNKSAPNAESLYKISKYFGVDISVFLEDE